MSRFPLRVQLLLLSLSLTFGFVIFGIGTWKTLDQTKIGGAAYGRIALYKDLVADILPPPNYIIESYLTVLLLADPGHADEREALLKHLGELRGEYDTRHRFWTEQALPDELRKNFLEQAHAPAKKFFETVDGKLLPALKTGQAATVNAAVRELEGLYSQHRQAIDRVVKLAGEEQVVVESGADTLVRRSTWVLLGIFVLSVAATLAVNLVFGRSIRAGIDDAKKALAEIATGNLSVTVSSQRGDELGHLLQSLNATVQQLRRTVSDIYAAAESVGSSSTQLMAGMGGIADASSAQSLAVASVAATVEEMSEGISQMAAVSASSKVRATDAEASCNSGSAEIETTVTVVEKLAREVQATAESIKILGEDSNQISSIVSSIREIADQTNLLALNAAIEAARAGETGRGFAVVADEVRKLAERTASSTDQIASMIAQIQSGIAEAVCSMSNGSEQARTSIEVVHRARHTMIDIAGETSALMREIAEIADSLEAQRTGSASIAEEIEKIADASNSNSASIQQVAATARDMSGTAQGLRDAVAFFKPE